jgi:hypothetical protein
VSRSSFGNMTVPIAVVLSTLWYPAPAFAVETILGLDFVIRRTARYFNRPGLLGEGALAPSCPHASVLAPTSPLLAGKTLLQYSKPVERVLRQRAFLHSGQGLLELAWRCHAN